MNSKEKFLEAATELFSKFGFSRVSVRDIAKVLGMRESAMYKHFSSKADILESIILKAKFELENFQKSIIVDENSVKNTVYNLQERLFDLYTLDPFMNRFRKIMIISQYENDESKLRYEEMFISKSLRYYETVFSEIIEAKKLKYNAKYMAYELYSPMFLLMQQNDCINELDKIEQAKELLTIHTEAFFTRYAFLEVRDNEY